MEKIQTASENGIQLSDRELAVRWWGRLSNEKMKSLLKMLLPTFSIDSVDYETQYWIWLKQQESPRNLQ